MSKRQLDFEISEEIESDEIVSLLDKSFRIKESPRETVNRGFYDSFDWRIYAKGMVLEVEAVGRQLRLICRPIDSPFPRNRLKIHSVPRFAGDIPKAPSCGALTSLLGSRVLLRQVDVESTRRSLNVLNKDEKTVLRIVLEENRVFDRERNRLRKLGKRIRLQPIRGYNKHLDHARNLLLKAKGVQVAREMVMLQALSSLGRQPQDYSAKLNVQLEPTMRADAALRVILRDLLASLKINEQGARDHLDPEFLHDFRVAMRRTRSLLGQIKGVLPGPITERILPQLGALGRTTGAARDLDVYIEKFDSYQVSLPEAMQQDLNPLLDFLKAKQNDAYDDFRRILASAEYRRFKDGWSAYLDRPFTAKAGEPKALLPISSVASKAVWRAYKRVLKQGRAIDAKTPPEHFHELRKSAKKLRYLLEFFQSLYSKKEINKFIKALRALQDNLGAFQDLEVQETKLKSFSEEMLAIGSVRSGTLLAVGMLVQELERRRQITRKTFGACFRTFDSTHRYRQFGALVGKLR